MKTVAKRLLSLALGLCLAVAGVFTIAPTVTASAESKTETMSIIANKGTTGTNVITWTGDNIQFKNEKDTSTNAILTTDSNLFRVYAKSKVTISTLDGSNIEKIVITCTSTSYATACKNSIGSTATTNSSTVTATVNAPSISFSAAAQWRLNKIEVTYTLTEGAPSITLGGDNYMQVGEDLTITTNDSLNITEDFTWKSSNTAVAEVDEDGIVTGNKMGKATITASANGVEESKEITVYPVANSELTIAEAIEVCELTGSDNAPYTYSATGIIESIDYAYNETSNNITVFITDGENSLKTYKMVGGADLAEGLKITVTGALCKYNGTYEFNEGCTYVVVAEDNLTTTVKEALANTQAHMKLAYKYTAKTETLVQTTDTLNRATTGITSGSYGTWADKKADSNAIYAGQSAGGNTSIQLRSSGSNSGIVTTASGGKATKITVEWNSNTAADRTLQVYGKNTAYAQATDLYNSTTSGKLLGTIVYGTSTELEIAGDYEYIGLKSASGAMYLTSVKIEWSYESEGVTVLENSDFRIKCGIDASLLNLEGVEVGVYVTANGKEAKYTTTAKSWTVEGNMAYVVISLGDIGNNGTRLTTEFTVQAYAVVDDFTYVSENTKTYSVATMVAEYKGLGYDVEHLYNYLVEKGLIVVEEVA